MYYDRLTDILGRFTKTEIYTRLKNSEPIVFIYHQETLEISRAMIWAVCPYHLQHQKVKRLEIVFEVFLSDLVLGANRWKLLKPWTKRVFCDPG